MPDCVKQMEEVKRLKDKVKCKYPGCYGKTHKTNASKLCRYHNYRSRLELKSAIEDNLRCTYPNHYGIDSTIVISNSVTQPQLS